MKLDKIRAEREQLEKKIRELEKEERKEIEKGLAEISRQLIRQLQAIGLENWQFEGDRFRLRVSPKRSRIPGGYKVEVIGPSGESRGTFKTAATAARELLGQETRGGSAARLLEKKGFRIRRA